MGEIGGFVGLGAFLIGLFAWLHRDIVWLGERVSALERGQTELRGRMAKIEGLLEGLREAITGRSRAA